MAQISAVVLARNEEANIADCLSTLQWADELLVLDSYSDDSTVELARGMGAEVRQRRFDNYALQRNAALRMASKEWVLFVDADERVTEELVEEIKLVVDEDA